MGERRVGPFVLLTCARGAPPCREHAPLRLGEFYHPSQGEGQRDHIVRRFREAGNAILLGTDSFWELVYRAAALRGLVLAKLLSSCHRIRHGRALDA